MNQFSVLLNLFRTLGLTVWGLCLFLPLDLLANRPAMDLQIIEDRIWIDVEEQPLTSILQAFADRGIQVRMGPGIDAVVSGTLKDADLEQALADLLGPYNYVLNWIQIPTPHGRLIALDEIQVFRPGQRSQASRAKPEAAQRTIQTHPDGFSYVDNELLVGLKPGSTVVDLKQLLMHVGGSVVKSLTPPGIYVIRLGHNAHAAALVDSLKNHPSVAHAELNLAYTPVAPERGSPEPEREAPTPAPNILAGASAVAILDSGLLSLPELDGRIGASLDATDPARAMSDESGHGTQMALIASGLVTPNGAEALSGVSPIIPIRTFQSDGYASSSDLIHALQFSVSQGASVVNMSWGSSAPSQFLENTLRSAKASGLTLVAAAGNEPTGENIYPAAYPDVIAVAATGANHERWASSNYGDFVSLAAPGSARLPVGHNGPAGSYAGTSIASAYVASALSTYLANHTGLSREQGVQAFLNELTDAGTPGKDAQYGYGVLDQDALKRLGLVGN